MFDLEPGELDGYFREIAPLVAECQFSDCTHVHGENCAMLAAPDLREYFGRTLRQLSPFARRTSRPPRYRILKPPVARFVVSIGIPVWQGDRVTIGAYGRLWRIPRQWLIVVVLGALLVAVGAIVFICP